MYHQETAIIFFIYKLSYNANELACIYLKLLGSYLIPGQKVAHTSRPKISHIQI